MRKQARLAQAQVEALDALGFVWQPDVLAAKWHSNYHLARRWREMHGDLRALLPAAGGSADASEPATAAAVAAAAAAAAEPAWREVSAWLARQQQLYVRHKITPDRLALLRGLGGCSDPRALRHCAPWDRIRARVVPTHPPTRRLVSAADCVLHGPPPRSPH